MSSGSTLTSHADLGGAWDHVQVHVPTMTSATDIYIQTAYDSGSVYGRHLGGAPRTFSVTSSDSIIIGSSVSQMAVDIPNPGQYIKIEFSTATTATSQAFVFVCS
jgi:hypothetical protein